MERRIANIDEMLNGVGKKSAQVPGLLYLSAIMPSRQYRATLVCGRNPFGDSR